MKQRQSGLRRWGMVLAGAAGAMPAIAAAAGPMAQGAAFRIDDAAFARVINADVAQAADGSLAVVYQPDSGTGIPPLMARRIDAAGQPVGPPTAVMAEGGAQNFDERVAINAAGNFVVAWTDLAGTLNARAFAANGAPLGAAFRADDGAHPILAQHPDVSNAPPAYAVGIDGQNHILLAWTIGDGSTPRNQSGLPTAVVARRFGIGGEALDAAPFTVNGAGLPVRTAPAVGMADDGSFVVAWLDTLAYTVNTGVGQQQVDAVAAQVQFQRYSPLAAPLGKQSGPLPQVGNSQSSSNGFVSLSLDSNSGEFAIAWDWLNDAKEMYVQRFTAAGLLQGARLAYAYNNPATLPGRVCVGLDEANDVVTAWDDVDHITPSVLADTLAGISKALQPAVDSLVVASIGSTLTGRSYNIGLEHTQSMSMGPNGDFTIVYLSPTSDGTSAPLYGQRYVLR